MDNCCCRVTYSGRVQGVGFRFRTERMAQGFKVTGFVKNLSDGSVELTAEGERGEVERFLEHVRSSELSRFIQEEKVSWSDGSKRYSSFKIAY